MIRELARQTGLYVASQGPDGERWRGRSVRLVDGTTITMPDTAANQAAYPQQRNQKPGLGFPICRLVGITCLATGAMLDAAISRYQGKGAHEQALLREYHLLPDEQGEWRTLAFIGQLSGADYKVRRLPMSDWTATTLDQFGQVKALVSMNPDEDPRGMRYKTLMRLATNTGPVRWGAFLNAAHLGLLNLIEPAPWPAPEPARVGVATASPNLTADEQRILAQIWAAFPETAQWFAGIGAVTDLYAQYGSTAARPRHGTCISKCGCGVIL